jgi:hypothetical protein
VEVRLEIRRLAVRAFLMGALLASGGAFGQTPVHQPPASMTCPGDKLVWVNTHSHVYHFKGERYFGSTKEGKFICERDADKEGDRPTHNGQ